jgi:hypothetical protein
MNRRGERRASGFTIIEIVIVIVIGVIVVLIGILLPALSGSKASAAATAQASNIRQVGVLIDLYTENWDGIYPIADTRTSWHPTYVSDEEALALGLGRWWEMALIDAGLTTTHEFDEIYYAAEAFHTIAMYTDPRVMTPTTIPPWPEHRNSPVRAAWATYPAQKGLLGVGRVPVAGGLAIWSPGVPEDPKGPVVFADGSLARLRFSELREPEYPLIDIWGLAVAWTWHGIKGRDR